MPDICTFSLLNGMRYHNYCLYKSIPLSKTKKEKRLVSIKERLGQVDCYNKDLNKLCSAMGYIPQINIVEINTGNAVGFKITDYAKNALISRVRHYQDVTTDGDRIYSLYFGVQEQDLLSEKTNTELHVYDWEGNFLSRYIIPGLILGCWSTEKGLYVTKLNGDSMQLYIIPKTQINTKRH